MYTVIRSHYIASFYEVSWFSLLLQHDTQFTVCYIHREAYLSWHLLHDIKHDIKANQKGSISHLFVQCAELLAAMTSYLGQLTVCFLYNQLVKLSCSLNCFHPYIAWGRLSPLPPVIPTLLMHWLDHFCHF